jgi:hypothetical protein
MLDRIQNTYDFCGGGLLQTVEIPYSKMVKMLGKPIDDCDEKTDVEWSIKFKGECFSIYNYKEGEGKMNYNYKGKGVSKGELIFLGIIVGIFLGGFLALLTIFISAQLGFPVPEKLYPSLGLLFWGICFISFMES